MSGKNSDMSEIIERSQLWQPCSCFNGHVDDVQLRKLETTFIEKRN